MNPLTHQLERSILIHAPTETVFRFFTDSERWAIWWGAGSTIDAHPGGEVLIRYPNGVEVRGEVVEVRAPERIVFTYGYVSGNPVGPGNTLVSIHLESVAAGTRLTLTHAFANPSVRDQHVQGWRYQLAVFANTVSSEVFANVNGLADAWFDAWAITDAAARDTAFAAIASPGISFRDRYSCVDGLADLCAHVAGAQRFMPGIRLHRKGDARHCQGVALVDWVASGPDGKELMSGTNVFVLGPDGRIASATGIAR